MFHQFHHFTTPLKEYKLIFHAHIEKLYSVNPEVEISRSRRTESHSPRPDSRRSRETGAPERDWDWVLERELPWQRPAGRRARAIPVRAKIR